MKQIGIMIIDPRQLIREGFEKLLRRPLFNVVTTGKTLTGAFNGADMAQADVVVIGHSTTPEVEAQIAALRHLPAGPQRPRFVLMTEVEEADLLRRALAAGMDALLSKDISSRVFQRSLELVALGQWLFPASLVHPLQPAPRPAAPSSAAPDRAGGGRAGETSPRADHRPGPFGVYHAQVRRAVAIHPARCRFARPPRTSRLVRARKPDSGVPRPGTPQQGHRP